MQQRPVGAFHKSVSDIVPDIFSGEPNFLLQLTRRPCIVGARTKLSYCTSKATVRMT